MERMHSGTTAYHFMCQTTILRKPLRFDRIKNRDNIRADCEVYACKSKHVQPADLADKKVSQIRRECGECGLRTHINGSNQRVAVQFSRIHHGEYRAQREKPQLQHSLLSIIHSDEAIKVSGSYRSTRVEHECTHVPIRVPRAR